MQLHNSQLLSGYRTTEAFTDCFLLINVNIKYR